MAEKHERTARASSLMRRVTLLVTLFVCIALGACSPPPPQSNTPSTGLVSAFDITHIFNLTIEPDLAVGGFRFIGDADLFVVVGSTDIALNGTKTRISSPPVMKSGELYLPNEVVALLEQAIYRKSIYSYAEPSFVFTPTSPSPLPSYSRPIQSAKPLLGTVVLDPGHGGRDSGAVGPRTGVFEKDLNLSVAKRVQSALVEKGVKVVMTRSDDKFIPLEQRAVIANSVNPDCFVSIHFNASTATIVKGFEVYYSNNNPFGKDRLDRSISLGNAIAANLQGKWSTSNRGVRHASFYVTRHTRMPSVLVEVEFLSNTELEPMLTGDWFQKRAAAGIVEGIESFLSSHSR